MITLHILIAFVALIFLAIYTHHKYIEYKEDRDFWKEIDKMNCKNNKFFLEVIDKVFENMDPLIIDFFKKNNKK